jgi:hypothetical protein
MRLQEVRLVWPVIAAAARILQQRSSDAAAPPLRLVLSIAAPHLREAMLTALVASGLHDVLVWEVCVWSPHSRPTDTLPSTQPLARGSLSPTLEL